MQSTKKASRLYKKIGDRVSYAYTLWSLATTHKMKGSYRRAFRNLEKAESLFKITNDPRGLVYCKLGYGELRLLAGDRTGARRFFKSGLSIAEKFGFKVEAAHAKMLLERPSGYIKLGIKLDFQAPPYNLP